MCDYSYLILGNTIALSYAVLVAHCYGSLWHDLWGLCRLMNVNSCVIVSGHKTSPLWKALTIPCLPAFICYIATG